MSASSPKHTTDPKFTANQDGKLPSDSPPFSLARRVSDIGALAQGGADLTPTLQAVDYAKVDYIERESATSKVDEELAAKTGHSLSIGGDQPAGTTEGSSANAKQHSPSILKRHNVFSAGEKKGGSAKASDYESVGPDVVSGTSSTSPHAKSDTSHANKSSVHSIPDEPLSHPAHSATSSENGKEPHHFFHIKRRPSDSASLEGLVENELKNLLGHHHHLHHHTEHLDSSQNSKKSDDASLKEHNGTPLDKNPHTPGAATSIGNSPSKPASKHAAEHNSTATGDANEPPQPVRRCSWIPPESGNPSKDLDVEDARARWFSYENFKDSMYSKLHGGTGPTGPAGAGVPSGTSTPL